MLTQRDEEESKHKRMNSKRSSSSSDLFKRKRERFDEHVNGNDNILEDSKQMPDDSPQNFIKKRPQLKSAQTLDVDNIMATRYGQGRHNSLLKPDPFMMKKRDRRDSHSELRNGALDVSKQETQSYIAKISLKHKSSLVKRKISEQQAELELKLHNQSNYKLTSQDVR